MTGALIILAVTVLTGFVLWLTRDRQPQATETDPGKDDGPASSAAPADCCGRHAVCDKVITPDGPVYFDDEELDRFAGREPDSYTPDETEEFRQVLYTLLPTDVYPWGVSLTVRDIALPLSLRDEWIMLCADNPTE